MIGIAIEAFESWLARDVDNAESIDADQIKGLVAREKAQRVAIATTMDLKSQMKRTPSLGELHRKLASVVPALLAS